MSIQTNMGDISDRVYELVGQLAECLNASDMNGTERLLAVSTLISVLAEGVMVEHPEGPHAEIRALKEAVARLGMAALNEMVGDGDSPRRERGE